MHWKSLAKELRTMILEALVCEGNVAHCASVCREWQIAIEKHNFYSLKIAARDIPIFTIMATRNLGLIRYIWYSIELENYDSSECDLDETDHVMNTNRATVENGVRAMLCALSARPFYGNMTLDISIHSPSDSQHHFKYIRFDAANTGGLCYPVKLIPGNDSVYSSSIPLPSIAAIDRIFPDIDLGEDDDDFWTFMPRVSCVTKLLLRRQTRRRWNPIALSGFITCLPNLQELCFEPWREWGRCMQIFADKRSTQFFKALILRKLKKLTLFEDLNEVYISVNSTGLDEALDAVRIRTTSVEVAREVAQVSLGLQYLSAAFIVDAGQFWEVCQPHWAWEQLQTLALTSQDLAPCRKAEVVNNLIYSTAQAIKNMPKLQILEIWNGGRGHASVFRYKHVETICCARIVWRSSWKLNFEARVIRAWENIAEARNARHLQIQDEALEPVEIRSHGEAVLLLELEIEVACPVSIQQIHQEHLEIAAS